MQSVIGAASETLPNPQQACQVSFERIYGEWFGQVSRWVLALGARQSDYEDVVQEVFAVAYRRLHLFDGNNTAGWLYQIARRKARDYRQLGWVRFVFPNEAPASLDLAQQTGPGPLDQLETKQKTELLSRRLAQLPSEQQAVFMLFELEGFTGHEIAQRQQVPLNTVWVRLYRARKKLECPPQARARRSAGSRKKRPE